MTKFQTLYLLDFTCRNCGHSFPQAFAKGTDVDSIIWEVCMLAVNL